MYRCSSPRLFPSVTREVINTSKNANDRPDEKEENKNTGTNKKGPEWIKKKT